MSLKQTIKRLWCWLVHCKRHFGTIGKSESYYYLCDKFKSCVCKRRLRVWNGYCKHCDPSKPAKTYDPNKRYVRNPSYPKDQMCRNCAHGTETSLYCFCREPERMKDHQRLYLQNEVPKGGFPQSQDYWCAKWKKQEKKQDVGI